MSFVTLPESEVFTAGNFEYGVTFVTCTNGETVCRGRGELDGLQTRDCDEIAREAATEADRAFCKIVGTGDCISVSHFPFWHGGYGAGRHEFEGGNMFAQVARREILSRDEDGRLDDVSGWEWLGRDEIPAELATKIDAAIAAADAAFNNMVNEAEKQAAKDAE